MQAVSQAFRCFDAVARRGSVRKAAEVLHLTAAAVHQQVLNLEAQVGTPLFDRLPKGMQLTAAGEIVLASVRRMQRDYEQALAQVEALRTLRRGQVNLGVPHATAEALLPAILGELLARHPGLRFDVRSGNGEALLRWLAGGEIDLAFCLQRMPPPGVAQVRAWPQRLGAAVAPGHPLAARGARLKLRDCLAHPLVLPAPDMELRLLAERIAAREQRRLEPVVQTSSFALARALAASGGCVALLLQESVQRELAAGTLQWLPLADAGARAESCLYQRVGQNPAVAAGVFMQALDASLQELAG